ncbi:hypothetical protein Ancab_015870 [Ancistrocladus abbreviatus]
MSIALERNGKHAQLFLLLDILLVNMESEQRDGGSSVANDNGVLSATLLAKEAAALFQAQKYGECAEVLNQLLQKRGNDLEGSAQKVNKAGGGIAFAAVPNGARVLGQVSDDQRSFGTSDNAGKFDIEFGHEGEKSLLDVPISFVSKHTETSEEIDDEYKKLVLKSGREILGCVPTPVGELMQAVIKV